MNCAQDPKGLIAEAYRMEELGAAECRSIYLDWALGRPEGADLVAESAALLAQYGAAADHPMTAILRAGAEGATTPQRRGGRARRLR